MPLIVAVHRDGTMNTDAGTIAHGGHTFEGPLFDVDPQTAAELVALPGFRHATAGDLPEPAPKTRARKGG